MLKKILILITLSTFLTVSIRSEAEDAIRLEKGVPSPYTGVLMPDSMALDLRNAVVDRDGYKLINDSLNRSFDFYKKSATIEEQKVDILLKRNNELAESVRDAQSFNNTQRVLWFVLGIAVTGIAVYGVKNLSNK